MTTRTELVHTYFRLAAASDLDAYFAQFADDAVVEDEGHEYHGIDELRRWRTSVPPVHYEVLDVVDQGQATLAHAEVSGEFAGSPVTLAFRFGFGLDEGIRTLAIQT